MHRKGCRACRTGPAVGQGSTPPSPSGIMSLVTRTGWLVPLWVLVMAAAPWTTDSGIHGPSVLEAPLSPLDTEDLSRAAKLLRSRVAYLRSSLPVPDGQPLVGGEVDGWGLITGPKEVTCQAFLVKDASTILVHGPAGHLSARVVALDLGLRVARLRLSAEASRIGLRAAAPSPPESREVGMDVLALVSTRPEAGVVAGVLTELGEAAHLEGNLRSDLKLMRGMPVFDTRLRWIGLARAVDWDKDRAMLIPPELAAKASSSTVSLAPRPRPGEAAERPWWAR